MRPRSFDRGRAFPFKDNEIEMTQQVLPWWKTATGYQIYPRSFCDSNGDGIGDLPGVISKLDHLNDLGIGFIWLSPIYASPMRDNGYDISDYHDIAPEFGTMDDFDRLLVEARERDIRIVMDLVVNHCSSDHLWFQKACADANCAEHDFFYWRDPQPDGSPPDDQRACFGGSAWHWAAAVGKYCYCHFGPQQPDLNWHNPRLRDEIYDMMNWWLDKGIGGFRMDVIELIGKNIDGREYHEGPDMHRFIQEMHRRCLAGRDILTVGETWAATPDTALKYCAKDRDELNMVFNFNHVQAAWDPELGRFGPNRFDLRTHKMILNDWQQALANDGWNSLYLSNHDLPRAVSHYGDDKSHRARSAKMLAIVHYLMKGTPFIYQGEEIGMTNAQFTSLDQFRDIETLGQLDERLGEEGSNHRNEESVAAFLVSANENGRDNARTPVQWNGSEFAGFSDAASWIDVNANYQRINVEKDRDDPDGVFELYRKIIDLRRSMPVFTQGSFELLLPDHPHVFAFIRRWGSQEVLVAGNFSDKLAEFDLPLTFALGWSPLLMAEIGEFCAKPDVLSPYFGGVWIREVGDQDPQQIVVPCDD